MHQWSQFMRLEGLTPTVPWDLTRIVAELRAAREPSDTPRVPRAGLPSREALVEIMTALRAALFPAQLGGADVREDMIDTYVAHQLDLGLCRLLEQVRRELRYTLVEPDVQLRSQEIVAGFAEQLPRLRTLLESDVQAALDGDPAAQSRDEIVFCYPGIHALIHHRVAHGLHRLGAPLLARIITELSHAQTGIDIHPGAQIGGSFFIDHGTGVVIGETSVIGERVRLYQGVTLGARSFPRDAQGRAIKGQPRHPVIEDDVVIYAGATVLGRITIGRGAQIGGNVWLTHGVAPGTRVAQSQQPAREVSDARAGS